MWIIEQNINPFISTIPFFLFLFLSVSCLGLLSGWLCWKNLLLTATQSKCNTLLPHHPNNWHKMAFGVEKWPLWQVRIVFYVVFTNLENNWSNPYCYCFSCLPCLQGESCFLTLWCANAHQSVHWTWYCTLPIFDYRFMMQLAVELTRNVSITLYSTCLGTTNLARSI